MAILEKFMMIIFCVGLWLTILSYVVVLIKFIACHKKHECKNDKCPIRFYCDRTAPSDKEIAEIERLRREIQKLIETQSQPENTEMRK